MTQLYSKYVLLKPNIRAGVAQWKNRSLSTERATVQKPIAACTYDFNFSVTYIC